jgi:hypothetical protein
MDPLLSALFRGEIARLCQEPDGRLNADSVRPTALLCGSFNPLHDGHRGLANVAGRRLGVPVAFELTVINADKPPLDPTDLMRRLTQFVHIAPIWLTRSPTFAEKAQLFPGTTFVVGVDTAERIVAERFYGNSVDNMHSALDSIRASGCKFLVAGRRNVERGFIAAESLALPVKYRDLFDMVSEAAFRHDLSSSQLRDQF